MTPSDLLRFRPFGRLIRTRPRRRVLVAIHVSALALAALSALSVHGKDLLPMRIGMWSLFVALFAFAPIGGSVDLGWNRIGSPDERQSRRWTEAKALGYQVLMLVLWPLLFWVGFTQQLRQLGLPPWGGVTPNRSGMLAIVLFVALPLLPVAIAAWREPNPAAEA